MQYDQDPVNTLTPLPANNIDTGLGLNRLAAIMQGTTSVFETDQIRPLIDLGEELSGRKYGETFDTDRALRILADHTRGMSFLVADGVVPSNEERGYVLRRLMRRAIVQGRRIGIEPGFLVRFADVVRELMAPAYPELHEHADTIRMWLGREEEQFGRTLEQGMRLLDDIVERAKEAGEEGIGADQAFLLHDTYGFPFDLTLELTAERGLGVDEQGFETLMEQQRERGREGGRDVRDSDRERIAAFADGTDATTFTGYETIEQATAVAALASENGRVLAKLVESPFYATGGGQVHDGGVIECEDGGCAAKVLDVVRVGDDQALVLEPIKGELHEGERVVARVDPARRLTERNHTATHLLHAALRDALGTHVRQAGSYVGPDKLRFDFTHGAPLTHDEVRAVEDAVNREIVADHPVRALTTTLDEAKSLGAMALFGEKYGDVVRMVEVGDGHWSRELCGGTHVRSTGVIGAFKITTETSSAANVRRIEAVTSQVALDELRKHDRVLAEAARVLRTTPDQVAEIAADREAKRRELEKRSQQAAPADDSFERRRRDRRREARARDQAARQPEGAARSGGPDQEPGRRSRRGRHRRAGRGPREPARGGDAGGGRARRQGRRGGQGGGPGRRRGRRRARQHGPGGRQGPGQAPRRPRRRARGDRARARRLARVVAGRPCASWLSITARPAAALPCPIRAARSPRRSSRSCARAPRWG